MKNIKYIPLCLALLLTACGNNQTQETTNYDITEPEAAGDMLTSATIGGATNLVPWLAGESGSSDITGHIYEGLLQYDKNLNIAGNLAESWDISADGLTFTFHLRKDVHWSDGTPFTSADVAATFAAITHPNTRTPYAGDYQLVKNFHTPDAYTVVVTYEKPFAPALSSWIGLSILPKHILDLDADVNETRLKTTPVGTGPYLLEKWEPNAEAVLKANPLYRKTKEGLPYLQRLRIRVLPDLDTQFLELSAQKLDMMGLKPIQYTRQMDKIEAHYTAYNYLGFGYTYLGFNLKNSLFADKHIRQALSYATPRQQLVAGVLLGQGQAIASVFKPGTWAYNKALTPTPYNLEKAKKLLNQAGWADTNNNGIVDKDGKEFAFTIVTNQGNDQRIKTAEILQQSWKQLGIDVEIQVQEWRTFIENTIEPRNFEAFIMGWRLTPEPDPYDIWHSSKQKPKEFNIIGFENARADELMEQARSTFNQAERKKYLDEFQAILQEEQPTLLLYAPYSLVALHKRIKGIDPAPAGLTHNMEDWYVPTPLQKTAITP